jgi:hypothetical protein
MQIIAHFESTSTGKLVPDSVFLSTCVSPFNLLMVLLSDSLYD